MCGLVGMMGDFFGKHKDMMGDLLYLDTLRGQDSTGVAALRRDGTLEWYKMTIPGYEYIQLNGYKDLLKFNDRVWLGHNRYKTVGNATRANAHPFVVENEKENTWTIVGAHNGTLKNKSQIDPKNLYGTDSEALINLISEVGPKEAIAKIEGAWALVWFDGVEDQLNIIRNEERPITFAFSEDRKVLFWASESWMLRAAAARRDIKLLDGAVWQPQPDELYVFDLPVKIGDPIKDAKITGGISGKVPVTRFPVQDKGWSSDNKPEFLKGYWTTDNGQRKWVEYTGPQSKTTTEVKTKSETKASSDNLIGFEGKEVSRQEVEELKKCGCGWCDKPVEGANPISWLNETTVLCYSCQYDRHFYNVQVPDNVVVKLTDRQTKALLTVKEARESGKK